MCPATILFQCKNKHKVAMDFNWRGDRYKQMSILSSLFMEDKKHPGQPTKMTEKTLRVLEDAFINGASDVQACFLAEISEEVLYYYQRKHPKYTKRKAALKDMIKYKAKKKIKHAIDTELGCDTAKWYLERRDSEFKPKSDLNVEVAPKPLLGGASTYKQIDGNKSNGNDKKIIEVKAEA